MNISRLVSGVTAALEHQVMADQPPGPSDNSSSVGGIFSIFNIFGFGGASGSSKITTNAAPITATIPIKTKYPPRDIEPDFYTPPHLTTPLVEGEATRQLSPHSVTGSILITFKSVYSKSYSTTTEMSSISSSAHPTPNSIVSTTTTTPTASPPSTSTITGQLSTTTDINLSKTWSELIIC